MLIATVLSAWLQYAADGQPHARAVVTADAACPSAAVDGQAVPMVQRAGPSASYDDVVCDALVPATAKSVAVGPRPLPAPAGAPKTVVVFGDTGCRLKGDEIQKCNDATDWPFPTVAASIAAAHPDLIVHVGDYYYRETPCTQANCAGPYGDNSFSWNADWFGPAAPLFASAPLVLVRGNHEDCQRGGPGWYRYLEPHALSACAANSDPWSVAFDGLQLVVADSATASDTVLDPTQVAALTAELAQARALAKGAARDTFLVTHRPPYTNVNIRAAMGASLAPYGGVLVGHVHTFYAMNVTGPNLPPDPLPPLVVNGEGGDKLDTGVDKIMSSVGDLHVVGTPFDSGHFGFAVYTKTAVGWAISLRNIDGSERARCTLAAGSVTC